MSTDHRVLDKGGAVREGEELARIYPIRRTGSEPIIYRAARDGILAARHFPGLVQAGDCLAVIGSVED